MKLKQNNVCAICKKPEMAKRGTLAIDHDKITGKIRGLLCFKCNFGIGYLQHDTELLAAAIKYLKDAEN